jgi:hypothetical protein
MQYFGGYDENEVAEALGVTTRSVSRDWQKTRVLAAGYAIGRPVKASVVFSAWIPSAMTGEILLVSAETCLYALLHIRTRHPAFTQRLNG